MIRRLRKMEAGNSLELLTWEKEGFLLQVNADSEAGKHRVYFVSSTKAFSTY